MKRGSKNFKNHLQNDQIIPSSFNENDIITLGDKVSLNIYQNDKIINIEITLNEVYDKKENIISIESPLGKAIFGKKVGDQVSYVVKTPNSNVSITADIIGKVKEKQLKKVKKTKTFSEKEVV